MSQQPQQPFVLTVDLNDVNVILTGMGELKLGQALNTFVKVQNQVAVQQQAQQQAQQPAPPAGGTEPA